jgi:hypothetical protein
LKVLSYAWNSPTRDSTLVVGDSYLKITKSVHDVLPYFTRHLESEYLELTAFVSIRRVAAKEKASAVDERYNSNAKETIMWLGENSNIIDKVIDAIPTLNTGLRRT